MINTDTIKIPIKGCRKLKYFKSLGYKIIDDFIEVKIEDLNTGSREIVAVKCDYCANDVDVTYKEYLRNIKTGSDINYRLVLIWLRQSSFKRF